MKNLFKILPFALPYWGSALLNIAFNVLSVAFSLVSFVVFIPVLQILFKLTPVVEAPPQGLAFSFEMINHTDQLKEFFYWKIGQIIGQYGQMQALLYIALVIVGLFFLKNFFRYMAMFFLAPLRNGVVRDLRNAMYQRVLILPLAYYTEQRKGDLMSRVTSDVSEVEWSIMSSLEMVFREPITILSYLAAMFYISPQLTGFVLVLLPLSGLLIGQIGKSLKRTSQKSQKRMGYLLSIIEETISGLRIIKAFNAIETSQRSFEKVNSDYNRLMVRLYRKRDLASPLSEFLGVLVIVVVLWFGGRLVLSPGSSMDAAVFLTYLGIFSQILVPAKAITQAWYNISKGAASVERIRQVLDADEVIVEKPDALQVSDFTQSIEYRDVTFRYEKEDVLRHINLTIPKGKTVALVGPSGGGKSTLSDLLPRFYDCTEGELLLDGVNVKDYKIDDLRGLMGIVSQETILFNDTVFNNIALGMDNPGQAAVEQAARIANAHEFIMQLPQGYQTLVGDRGVKLSGGQRQRLSIARAVLKNPPIMILDEATSALDTESERLVQEALENLMRNRTSVVIAHRLSTIQFADEIVVLQQGEIVERGSHASLIAQNGVYKRLCDLQSFE